MSGEGRRWFEQRKEFAVKPREVVPDTPDLWTRCPTCSELIYNETLAANAQVCVCGHHFRIDALARLTLLCDSGSLIFHDRQLSPVDALGFVDSKPYHRRIEETRRQTGSNDAYLSASATIDGVATEVGAFEFRYMGGSMGSVVGEAITRQIERAIEYRRPVVIISASGGARMQEGVLSLMQMAKTSAALARLKDEVRMPYISILTHPTTGGVAASFSMLGDLIFAEPNALIGFAGPRVIQQTIGEALPEGFQTAEYLLEHGMLDQIVPRLKLRELVARTLRQLLSLPASQEEEQGEGAASA